MTDAQAIFTFLNLKATELWSWVGLELTTFWSFGKHLNQKVAVSNSVALRFEKYLIGSEPKIYPYWTNDFMEDVCKGPYLFH